MAILPPGPGPSVDTRRMRGKRAIRTLPPEGERPANTGRDPALAARLRRLQGIAGQGREAVLDRVSGRLERAQELGLGPEEIARLTSRQTRLSGEDEQGFQARLADRMRQIKERMMAQRGQGVAGQGVTGLDDSTRPAVRPPSLIASPGGINANQGPLGLAQRMEAIRRGMTASGQGGLGDPYEEQGFAAPGTTGVPPSIAAPGAGRQLPFGGNVDPAMLRAALAGYGGIARGAARRLTAPGTLAF